MSWEHPLSHKTKKHDRSLDLLEKIDSMPTRSIGYPFQTATTNSARKTQKSSQFVENRTDSKTEHKQENTMYVPRVLTMLDM